MANRYPLILDSSNNKIKELPTGDNIDLTGAGISSVSSISVGTAVTINSTGINATGIITATTFSGSGSGLTGVGSTDNIITSTGATMASIYSTGIITATTFSGSGSGLTGVASTDNIITSTGATMASIYSTGIITATTFSGNLPATDLTGTITNAQLAGSIANAKLVNDSVSFGGVSVDLGASDATPAFDLSDATAYPYASLTGITTEIVGDTSPQLGGNLDINGKYITGTGGANITGIITATSIIVGSAVTANASGLNVTGLSTFVGVSTFSTNVYVAGNISVSGTVDGRDVATDGTKLDGIAASANNYSISTDLLDEDAFNTNSATKPASQQSIKAYVDAEVTALIGGAPGALDTLNELAAAIGDDSNYAAGITTALGLKAPVASPTFTGTVAIPNVADLESAVTANTAKVTNVTTDLAVSRSGSAFTVTSSDGTNASLPLADTDNWGLMSDEQFDKLATIASSANNYSHPSYDGDDFSLDTGALTGATVVSDIDINVTTDGSGHVTDTNGSVSTRTLTLANLGYTGATDANNYSISSDLLDEDAFGSNSATKPASQQSIKAYVDANASGGINAVSWFLS